MTLRAFSLDRGRLTQVFADLVKIKPIEPKITAGVDIGSSSIKILVLGSRRGNAPRPVIGQQLLGLGQGEETDVSEHLKTAVEMLGIPIRTINLSVSGSWVIMRVVELPTMSSHELRQALPFEAQRYLPFNLQDVILDGATLGPAGGNKSWVLIAACKKELIERRLDWVKRAGLEAGLIDVDALALTNSFLASRGGEISPESTHALMNVGAQLTNVVIFRGSLPYLVRDIPWGAEKLARPVAEQAGVQPAAVMEALEKGEVPEPWVPVMKLSCEALATELQLSFDYFENRFGQPPAQLVVSGGLSQSSSFLESVKSHFAQPITPWSPVSGLSGQFAVAYGLALRGDS